MAMLSNGGGVTARHLIPSDRRRDGEPVNLQAARRRTFASASVALVGAALLGGLVVAQQQSPWSPVPGFVYLLAVPSLVGAVHAAFSLALELSWPKARGVARRARMQPRSLGDVLERPLLVAHGVAVGLFCVIVVLGAALSRDGLTLAWGWNERSGEFLGVLTNTTFPGVRVTAPLTLVVVILLALAWLAMTATVRRPDVVSAEREQDLALRQAAAGRVLRVTTGVLLITDGLLTSLAGSAVAIAFGAHGSATSVRESPTWAW